MRLTSTLVLAALALPAADVKLPPPFHTPSNTNRAQVIPRPDSAQLRVPQGFSVNEFASSLEKPRIMLQAPGGELLVSEYIPNGRVTVLADKDKDGKADAQRKVLVDKLDRPYGLAFWKDYLYVAEATSLKRYKFDAKAVSVGPGEEIISLKDYTKGHVTRTVAFDSKGQNLYIGIGSETNSDPGGPEKRAAIWKCNPDGKACELYATGLRNPTSIYFYPGTNTLWATVQERDGLGDDLVPDFFTHIQQGGFYGWPYAYFGPNEDPRNKDLRPDLVKKTIVPDMSLGAHTAVIDWKFYAAKRFPSKYQGGAFFALHGSSNRDKRVGYSVVFVPFKNGKPSGPVEDFLTGWMLAEDKREVWGRPTGVTVLNDGNMLVSDDGGNRIWRVAYKK
jgi:glucose/arabinose dehydrogenase